MNSLKILIFTLLVTSVPGWATTKVEFDSMVLSGMLPLEGVRSSGSLKQLYNSPQSLFNWRSKPHMAGFFAQAVPQAEKTKGLIYLFGGPDVLFPQIIFPNFERMLLVGLEPPWQLDDVSRLSNQTIAEKISAIANAYGNAIKNSYFITSHMAKDLADKGSTTIIATGLAVQNFRVLSIDEISLDKSGEVVSRNQGDIAGVRIRFERPNKSVAEIFYFQFDLSDQNISRRPQFSEFIRRHNFDSAFYKAASFVSHLPNFKIINSLVLNTTSLVIQADDGIPYFDVLTHAKASNSWQLDLYGLYTPPHKMFGMKYQPQLKTLFAQTICWQGEEKDRELWQRVWSSGACEESGPIPFKSVRWNGYIPFRFGYGAVSGPDTLSWGEKTKFGTLMILSK